jgi:hypothetical protein
MSGNSEKLPALCALNEQSILTYAAIHAALKFHPTLPM